MDFAVEIEVNVPESRTARSTHAVDESSGNYMDCERSLYWPSFLKLGTCSSENLEFAVHIEYVTS